MRRKKGQPRHPRCTDTQMHRCTGTRVHGYTGTQVNKQTMGRHAARPRARWRLRQRLWPSRQGVAVAAPFPAPSLALQSFLRPSCVVGPQKSAVPAVPFLGYAAIRQQIIAERHAYPSARTADEPPCGGTHAKPLTAPAAALSNAFAPCLRCGQSGRCRLPSLARPGGCARGQRRRSSTRWSGAWPGARRPAR